MLSATARTVIATTLVALCGCGGPTRTLMPARIDLQSFRKIGLVEFSSNGKGQLQKFASQDFIGAVQSSQPGVPVLELGGQDQVLAAVGRDKVDSAAIQAIGEKFGVDAVIVGNLEVTDVKPRVDIKQMFSSVAVQANVEAALTTRLMDAGTGATVWTRSARSTESLANAGVSPTDVHIGVSDAEATYGTLVQNLVQRVTQDFRPYWVKN